MGLMDRISTGKVDLPVFCCLYAQIGVGKTTFAASAPDVLFLDYEHSSDNLDVAREHIDNFEAGMQTLNDLLLDDHPFKSLVIDTVDQLEGCVHRQVARDEGKQSIDDIGFQKGYMYALAYWDQILKKLNEIRIKKKMHIILLGHANVKRFNDPYLNEGYDRFEIKLHHKAADLIKEQVEMLLFARKDVSIKKERSGKIKAVNVTERLIHTQLEVAFDAKNRIGLPSSFEMPEKGCFQLLQQYISNARGETPEELYKQCCEATKRILDEDVRKDIQAYIDKNKTFTNTLRSALDRIVAKTKEH